VDIQVAVSLVKEGLGIRTNVRDSYLATLVQGVVKELEDEKGLRVDSSNLYHLLFIRDYAVWRYQSVGRDGAMPTHLKQRLYNFMIHVGGQGDDQTLEGTGRLDC